MYPYDSLFIRVSNLSLSKSLIRSLLFEWQMMYICQWESENERKGKRQALKKSIKRKRQLERKKKLEGKREWVGQKKTRTPIRFQVKWRHNQPRATHEARPNRLHAKHLHFLPIRRRITCRKEIVLYVILSPRFLFIPRLHRMLWSCPTDSFFLSQPESLLDHNKLSDSGVGPRTEGANGGIVPYLSKLKCRLIFPVVVRQDCSEKYSQLPIQRRTDWTMPAFFQFEGAQAL